MRRSALLPWLLLAACATKSPPTPKLPPLAVDAHLRDDVIASIKQLGRKVDAAVWLSRPLQAPALEYNSDAAMPVASAIKAAYLVELFAEFPGTLDAPLPDAAEVLDDDKHPSIAHFTREQRATARQALRGASVRRIGEAMITSKGVDNITYNIAANLVTAHFGGPEWLQARLLARDPSWMGLQVHRYMLADRTQNGDNTATAAALAAVHGMLASRAVPGVDPRAIEAAREVLHKPDDAVGRHVFAKGGALDSWPVTRVEAGWHETANGPVVHVVMLQQVQGSTDDASEIGARLGEAAKRIESMLLHGLR
jgi:hypothetical protein